MNYLSPEIKALAKKAATSNSLVKKQYSCGIFQDYSIEENNKNKETSN